MVRGFRFHCPQDPGLDPHSRTAGNPAPHSPSTATPNRSRDCTVPEREPEMPVPGHVLEFLAAQGRPLIQPVSGHEAILKDAVRFIAGHDRTDLDVDRPDWLDCLRDDRTGAGQGPFSGPFLLLGNRLHVADTSPLIDKTIASSGLRARDILVLSIERAGHLIPLPTAERVILHNDGLICYGPIATIRKLSQISSKPQPST